MSSLPHTQTGPALFKKWNVDPTQGLAATQVLENRKLFGDNGTLPRLLASGLGKESLRSFWTRCASVLPDDPPTPLWELILEQFKDQLVIILLAAAGISFVSWSLSSAS